MDDLRGDLFGSVLTDRCCTAMKLKLDYRNLVTFGWGPGVFLST